MCPEIEGRKHNSEIKSQEQAKPPIGDHKAPRTLGGGNDRNDRNLPGAGGGGRGGSCPTASVSRLTSSVRLYSEVDLCLPSWKEDSLSMDTCVFSDPKPKQAVGEVSQRAPSQGQMHFTHPFSKPLLCMGSRCCRQRGSGPRCIPGTCIQESPISHVPFYLPDTVRLCVSNPGSSGPFGSWSSPWDLGSILEGHVPKAIASFIQSKLAQLWPRVHVQGD